MSEVKRCGDGLIKVGINVDAQLVIDPVWQKYPKLFQIWVYIQGCKYGVSYGAIAKAFGISTNAVAKHIKTMKGLEFQSGAPVLEVASVFDKDKKNKRSVYRVTVASDFRNTTGAIKAHEPVNAFESIINEGDDEPF